LSSRWIFRLIYQPFAFDLAFDLALDLSLDFSFEFPSIQLGFSFDIDLDLSLPSLELDLSIPDLDFSLPKLDLDVDLPIPSFDFNLDFTFSVDLSGGFVIDMPMATIKNHIPYLNVLPFGMCTSGGNPLVAAALGAPQPCTPITPSPWDPGATTVLLQGVPMLDNTSTLKCNFGGTIKIVFPGQTSVFVP
jgi:hypothetical protein